MKSIKFKARPLELGLDSEVWIYGTLPATKDKSDFTWEKYLKITNRPVINPETICLYSGFKDPQGCEIYEHDIIECLDKRDLVAREYEVDSRDNDFRLIEHIYDDKFENNYVSLQSLLDNEDINLWVDRNIYDDYEFY